MEKKHLNKIVFIHSANIPYEEVELNGNIHLTGNQGTGKTSILRAAQFFYTADKTKLGINPTDPGKKSFEEFYFPYSYSYIIYEVNGSEGLYSIVALRAQGRICYHFIDAPFSKDWIFDNGQAISEWFEIRNRIKANCSARVITKEQYKDIIYGCFSKTDRSFHKYALMCSKKYHQLPLILQNVFLNDSLKAEQIKDTIVEAVLNGESGNVNLNDYREELKKFESEYQDIMLWFKEQSDGHVEVRDLAETIRDKYIGYKEYESNIRNAFAELLYANQRALEQVPMLKKEYETSQAEISVIKKQLEDTQKEYRETEHKLIEQIGAKKDWLKTCQEKRAEYARLTPSIDEIISRCEAQETLNKRIKNKESHKEELLQQHGSIQAKYDHLIQNENHHHESTLLDIEKRETLAIANYQKQINPLSKVLQEANNKAFDDYQRAQKGLQKQIEDANNELSRRLQIKANHTTECHFEQKLTDLRKRLSTQVADAEEKAKQIKHNEEEITIIQKELDINIKGLQAESEQKLFPLRAEMSEREQDKETLSGQLATISNSLLVWLDEHPELDAESIKKVINPNLLVRTDLSPSHLPSTSNSVFGLAIDMDAIEPNPQSVKSLQNQLFEMDAIICSIKEKINKVEQDAEKVKSKLEDSARSQIRTLNEQNRVLKQQLNQLPTLINLTRDQLQQAEQEETDWHKEQTQIDNTAIEEQTDFINDLNKSVEHEVEKYKKSCGKNNDTFEKDKLRYDQELQSAKESLQKARESQKANHEKTLTELNNSRDNEVKGNGVDISIINNLDKEISECKKEQKFIEDHTPLVARYNVHKGEYFDKEDAYRLEKNRLDNEYDKLKEAQKVKEADIKTQLSEQYEILNKKKGDLDQAENDIQEFKDFSSRPRFAQFAYLEPYPTTDPCVIIIKRIQVLYDTFSRIDSEMKDAVRTFAGKFSKGNIFKFETTLETDAQILVFATKLVDFLEHNVLNEYMVLLSNLYQHILIGLSHEVDSWRNRRADIEKLVNELNTDFANNGFAGVIKEIRLKVDDTDNRLVNLLYKIAEYARENEFNFDSYNLFNSETRKTEKVVYQSVQYLQEFNRLLNENSDNPIISIADTFVILFRIKENNNDTGWQTRLKNVGSDGTDVLVKSIINIMLVNVFKKRIVGKVENLQLHCMMDEIGRLHTDNIKGLIKFANDRDIWIVNGSPSNTEPQSYRHTYLVVKDADSRTHLRNLISQRIK